MPDRYRIICRLRNRGLTDAAIAAQLGISPSALSHWLRRHGQPRAVPGHAEIPAASTGRPMKPQTRRALILFLQGVPLMQAAKVAGANWRAVVESRRRRGIPSKWKRLDADRIAAIYRDNPDLTARELAAEQGTTETTVWTYACRGAATGARGTPRRKK